MKKEELIEELNEQKKTKRREYFNMPKGRERAIIVSRVNGLLQALELIDQLDEPELPVIPQFVADWIELCKERADLSDCLRGSFNYGQYNFKTEIITQDEDWLFEYDHADLVARAWLDGYEIIPEKKMQVTIKSYDKTELEIELPESKAKELIDKLRGVEM